jgi:hypothetical protein
MTDQTAASNSPNLRTITLDVPLDRPGAEPIASVIIRKPNSGELRGLTLMALSQLDYVTLETLLPRITMPILHKADIARLDPADLMQFGGEVMDFLLPKAAKEAVSPAT